MASAARAKHVQSYHFIRNSPNELGGGRHKCGPYESANNVVGTRLIASAARAKQCAVLMTHQSLARGYIRISPNELGDGRHECGPYDFIN